MNVHTLLVRCQLARIDGLRHAAERFCAASGLLLQRAAWSEESRWAYVYGELPTPGPVDAGSLPQLAQSWSELLPAGSEIDVSRLELAQDLPGASADATPTRHYVVETDPEAGWEDDILRWYRQEHLPGLAAVPGCIRARRFVNHDAGPRSHACYALVSEDTLGCPPWLAVRGTAWSSRVRPHFTNTRRTMMVLAP